MGEWLQINALNNSPAYYRTDENKEAYIVGNNFNKFIFNANMNNTFRNCYNLHVGVENIMNNFYWNEVNYMTNTFMDSAVYGNGIIPENVIYASNAYKNCYNLTSCYSTDNIVNMNGTYYDCHNIEGNIHVSNNALYLDSAYYNCHKASGIDIGSGFVYIKSGATAFNSAFYNCGNLIFNLWAQYNFYYEISMYQMCRNCYNLQRIGWNFAMANQMAYAFSWCNNMVMMPIGVNADYLNFWHLENGSHAFYECNEFNGRLDGGDENIYNNYNSPVNLNRLTDASYMFYNCTNLVGTPLNLIAKNYNNGMNDYMGNPNFVDMRGMYYNCRNLTGKATIGNSVVYLEDAYRNCINLTKIQDISVYDRNSGIARTVYMNNAFNNCYSMVGYIPFNNSVQFAATLEGAFYNCSNLIGNFPSRRDFRHFSYTFYNCRNLTGNFVCEGNFNTYQGANDASPMEYTFYGCTNLDGVAIWNAGANAASIFNHTFDGVLKANKVFNLVTRSVDVYQYFMSGINTTNPSYTNTVVQRSRDRLNNVFGHYCNWICYQYNINSSVIFRMNADTCNITTQNKFQFTFIESPDTKYFINIIYLSGGASIDANWHYSGNSNIDWPPSPIIYNNNNGV